MARSEGVGKEKQETDGICGQRQAQGQVEGCPSRKRAKRMAMSFLQTAQLEGVGSWLPDTAEKTQFLCFVLWVSDFFRV